MIEKMNKYSFVVLASKRDEFLDRLQQLGLVDVTTTGWEPSEADRQLLGTVERYNEAIGTLKKMSAVEGFVKGKPYASGDEAMDHYTAAKETVANLRSDIARYQKTANEVAPWGEFSGKQIEKLRSEGVVVRFFVVTESDFQRHRDEWSESYTIDLINTVGGFCYFVIVTTPDQDVQIDAQEVKALTMTATEANAKTVEAESEIKSWDKVWSDCAASIPQLETTRAEISAHIAFNKVTGTGTSEADGSLVLMEAWAEDANAATVDKMLDSEDAMLYIKSRPTPEDDTPIKLKNNRFARLFEFIGNFYALPKYGTMDLTPYFGPFYMFFFGFCLADMGYGLILFLGGLFLALKGGNKIKDVGKLTMLCGAATIVFGFFAGSAFGIVLGDTPMFTNIKHIFLTTDNLFTFALAIGFVQILFGMLLKVITVARVSGIKYTFATIGWMIVIVSTLAAMFLPKFGVTAFSTSSIPFYVLLGIGGVMMLFLNNPERNPLLNFAPGLWDTYNNITGLLGDVLSYIRLFAIGLSGGILAQVFNSLAFGLTADFPIIVKQLVIVFILLLGHGINLFMSCLSSFVHPMRLTFVEFYKNAGFEASMRPFTPFKK